MKNLLINIKGLVNQNIKKRMKTVETLTKYEWYILKEFFMKYEWFILKEFFINDKTLFVIRSTTLFHSYTFFNFLILTRKI